MSNINKKALKGLLQASEQAFTAGINFLLVAVKEDWEIEVTGSPEVIGGHQNEITEDLANFLTPVVSISAKKIL